MLPGFRFLFAAIILSTSVLVFGLGATAIMRAAHERFEASGSWRPAPEAPVAQQNEMTVLAMLRVDPPVAAPKVVDVPTVGLPAQSAETVSSAPEVAKAVTLDQRPAPDTAQAETEPAKVEVTPQASKTETVAAQVAVTPPAPVALEPANRDTPPARADAAAEPAVPAETKVAAVDPAPAAPVSLPAAIASTPAQPMASTTGEPDQASQAPQPASQQAAAEQAASEQTTPPAATEPNPAMSRIATLGGPPVPIGAQLRTAAQIEKDKQRAEDRARRRRLAARRARLAREMAAAQQAANPFGQTYQATQFAQPTTATVARTH
jgi:hypothetical protein